MIASLFVLMFIILSAPAWAAPSISVSPSSVVQGTDVTATWANIDSPVSTDWIGTYAPAAANTAYQSNWVYVNCTQVATSAAGSGSCSISTSALSAGTYELRLLIADGFTSVATSSTFTVTSNPASATLFAGPSGTGSPNNCTSSGSPCHIVRALAVATCGAVIGLQDGVYTGANNVIDTFFNVPLHPTCTLGNEITVAAINDGAVTIDAGAVRAAFGVYGLSYWKFSGFDATNGADNGSYGVGYVQNSDHITVQRVCVSNVNFVPPYTVDPTNSNGRWNLHVFPVINSGNNLFEDMCVFGTGREIINERDSGSTNNVFRRVWTRWEGWYADIALPGECGGQPLQNGYSAHQTSTYENFITIYSGERIPATGLSCYDSGSNSIYSYRSTLTRDTPISGDHGNTYRGFIGYGYSIATRNFPGFRQGGGGDDLGGALAIDIKDLFFDHKTVTANAGPMNLNCVSGACSGQLVDRVTTLRPSGIDPSVFANSGQYGQFTNVNECTSASACPNFYTGTLASSLGARNCFEYTNGVLGTAPDQRLWPWRMDDRIKAALAYENAAGRGGTALSGSAGSGYAANTVTSEIVSRYGSVPSACLREAVFTPSFPVASDFPSVSVRDDFDRVDSGTLGGGWTELTSDVFSIASNVAAAPASGFARAIYTDTKLQPSHEVYATWPTVQSCCGYMTVLSFAGTTNLSANSQYRYEVNRQSSGNTMVKVVKIDSGGSSTTIINEVDLGTDIADTNSFGVRVSGTTLSIYWQWTDGIWYRVGSVTDSTLASLPSSGVYGGISGVVRTTINNFGAGPFVDQPAQDPPTPPASVGAGRFGTTFPGVR